MEVSEALNKATVKIAVKSGMHPEAFYSQENMADDMLTSFFALNPYSVSEKDSLKMKDIREFIDKNAQTDFEKATMLKDIRHRLSLNTGTMSELDRFHQYIKFRSLSTEYDQKAKLMES